MGLIQPKRKRSLAKLHVIIFLCCEGYCATRPFSDGLMFPGYFGKNWDALYDHLSDLEWVKEKDILIVHHDIPFKNNLSERKKYIELLIDVIDSWENSTIHNVYVLFPEIYKVQIEHSLN